MSEQPITHCEHGIDRAYRCIDCIEAERDALRARVEVLEKERDAIQFKLEGVQCEVGDAFANWRDFQKLAAARHAELESLHASIAALADEWDAIAKRQRYQAEWDARRDYADSAAVKDGKAIGYEACARELRQLGEGNGRD